ncbi:MAG TPA: phage capsid protein [Halanaerobiales bacterium]|nr:phage capsid protein [Halanaerobiales bacterium]
MDKGDTVHYPYFSSPSAVSYTPGSDITIQEFSSTDETLTVDQKYVVPAYVDDVNALQMNYSYRSELQERAAYKLRDEIDQDVLGEVTNAGQTMDDGDLGGTSGSAITATTANIVQVFTTARKKLRDKNVPEAGDFAAVVSTATAEIIERTAADKGFQVADSTLKNGYGGNFLGFKVYISNNLDSTAYNGTSVERHIFAKKGAISLAVQQAPMAQMKEVSNRLGANILVHAVWGVKTFTKRADWMVDAPISA